MWESPLYKFKGVIEGKKEEIFIDVTGSAPNFNEPGKQLEGTFAELLKGLDPAKTKILDFGGAKLRNTLYLLQKGYTVYSCEFEDLFKRSKQAHDFLEECKKHPNFKSLVFPKDFIDFKDQFDVVLLINVLNIMPVPIERYCVLALCREKMKEGGRLLWYTQHGAYSKENAVTTLFDGLVTGKGRNYKMFYRDFSRKEIHDMLNANGFSFNTDFKFPSSGTNQAYVFNADGDILVDQTLGLTEQLKSKIKRELKTIKRDTWKTSKDEADPGKRIYETGVPQRATKLEEVNLLQTYYDEMIELTAGKKAATQYHKVIFNIVKSIFEDKLKKPKMEEQIADGTQRVDITFQNHREKGFFKQLAEGYNLVCPNIFLECKNYKEDLKNPEFFQMRCRLNKVRGQFGIIICRKIVNHDRVKKAQDDAVKKEEYFLVFEDTDVENLVKLKLENKEDEIDDYIEEKFKALT